MASILLCIWPIPLKIPSEEDLGFLKAPAFSLSFPPSCHFHLPVFHKGQSLKADKQAFCHSLVCQSICLPRTSTPSTPIPIMHLSDTVWVLLLGLLSQSCEINTRGKQCFWSFLCFQACLLIKSLNPKWNLKSLRFPGEPQIMIVCTVNGSCRSKREKYHQKVWCHYCTVSFLTEIQGIEGEEV